MIQPDPQDERYPEPEKPFGPAPEPAARYPFWSYQDVALFAALSLPLLAVALILVNGLFWLLGWTPRERIVQLLLAQFVFYVLWLLLLYMWMKVRYDRPFWRSLAFIVPPRGLWGSFGWGILTALVIVIFGALLRPPDIQIPLMEMLRSRLSIALVGGFAVTLGPLFEELAFRGFLQPLLVRSLTAAPGIIITAVLFTSLHGPEYAWSWRHLMLVSLAGMAFGWMRYRSGSTATAVVMHAGYNLMFFVGLVAQKGF